MSEVWKTIALLAAVFVSRLWSMFEHRKTKKAVRATDQDIREIKIYINGDTKRKIEEARQQGILEGIEIQKNKENNN